MLNRNKSAKSRKSQVQKARRDSLTDKQRQEKNAERRNTRKARTQEEKAKRKARTQEQKRLCQQRREKQQAELEAYDEVNFATTELTKNSHMDNFEQKPEVAVMMWHRNSGMDRFEEIDNLLELAADSDEFKKSRDKLIQEIQGEALDQDQKHKLVQDFCSRQGCGGYEGVSISNGLHHNTAESFDCPILTCSACGMRDCNVEEGENNTFVLMDLKNIDSDARKILELKEEELQVYEEEMALDRLTIPTDSEGTRKKSVCITFAVSTNRSNLMQHSKGKMGIYTFILNWYTVPETTLRKPSSVTAGTHISLKRRSPHHLPSARELTSVIMSVWV
jgi:hypothetical protein